jgi:hypothetical protein
MTGRALDATIVAAAMRKALREVCRENGVCFNPDTDFDPSDYYGFAPADVAMIHNHKRGAGAGLWFRLRNGRVFDKTGEAAERDPALYDTWTD